MKTKNFLSAVLLVAGLSCSAFAADPSLRLTVPRTTHPPTLDGKITPGEWEDATAVTGVINQLDGVAHPRQATFWLKYDDKYFYVAQRSTLLPGEKRAPAITLPAVGGLNGLNEAFNRASVAEVMPPLYFKDNQNVVTIALSPNRINSGDTPSYYRFMANINSTNLNRRELCDQIKGVRFVSISSVWDSLDARHVPNNTKAFNSFTADDTVWESEYAIPLSEMKVDKTPIGEEWGILLARDYPQQDQNAIVQSDSYRFDYMARDWRNLVVMSAYHVEKNYARARLVDGEPVVQVLSLGDFLSGNIQPSVTFYNPTAKPVSVTVKISAALHAQHETVELAAGERKQWTANEINLRDNVSSTLNVSINDAAGNALYEQHVPFRTGYGRDRTTYVPDMWLSGEPKVCAGAICATTEYNPIHNSLWAKVMLAGRPGEEQKGNVELSVRRAGEEKPFVTYPMAINKEGVGHYVLHTTLPELKPGVYEITASLYAREDKPQDTGAAVMNATNLNPMAPPHGKLIARSRDLFIRYDHEKDLPWIGNKIGLEDKVLPPWTPIVTQESGDNLALSCWGRTYEINGTGFASQIKTLDENILTGPIRFEVTRDGKPLTLTPAAKVSDVHASGTEVNYAGGLEGDGWKITTTAHMEYDGYIQYHVRLAPQGSNSKVDRIKLVIPLTNDQGRYLHAASNFLSDMRGIHSTEELKTEKGPLWDSTHQVGGVLAEGFGLTVGTFKPYVWVGGVKRGLAFMADNDKDWVPDETHKAPSIEVIRTDTGVEMVLNIIARPFEFDHAREITFSLQATPVKPLADDFRAARLKLGFGTAFVGFSPDGWSWDGCQLMLNNQLYLGGNGTAPFPLNRKRNEEWLGKNALVNVFGAGGANQIVTKYMAMNAHFAHYEVNDPHVPGLQGANWYGYLTPEIGALRDIGDASMSETEVEYRTWRYQKWVHELGLQGFYFDNSFTGYSATPEAGLGYVIDIHDRPAVNGQIQPGFAWTGIRHMCQRLRSVILAEGKRPYIWLHGSDTFAISAYSFADFVLDGEDGPQISPTNPWFSEKWAPGYLQSLNDSSKWGFGVDMLEETSGFEGPNNVGQWRKTFRDISGYMMLHDLEGSSYRYLDWTGLDLTRPALFLPYWDKPVATALQTGDAKVFASAWRQDNALRIEVFNRSGEDRKNLTVRIDPKALGIVPTPGRTCVVKALDSKVPKPNGTADDPYIQWPGDVVTGFQNNGDAVVVTLDVLAHNYRIFRVEESAK